MLRRETATMFGLFPPLEAHDAKLLMVSFEIVRIHQRQ